MGVAALEVSRCSTSSSEDAMVALRKGMVAANRRRWLNHPSTMYGCNQGVRHLMELAQVMFVQGSVLTVSRGLFASGLLFVGRNRQVGLIASPQVDVTIIKERHNQAVEAGAQPTPTRQTDASGAPRTRVFKVPRFLLGRPGRDVS